MERASKWERCRTGVTLRVLCISIQQHMACQRTARLVMVISRPAHTPAVHGCSPSPPRDVVVERRRGRGQPCASRKISTEMCAPTRTGCRVGDAAGCGTHAHTHAHMQLAGSPPSTPQHEEGVRRQTWRVCVVVWAMVRQAWRGGHGQLRSWSAWFPPVPSQEKRECV